MIATTTTDTPEVESRHQSPYTLREKLGRVLWWFVQATLFRWSGHNMYGWRRFLLKFFGARLASSARLRPTVSIECPWNLCMEENTSVGDRAILYALGPITIKRRASVSQHTHLCAATHDYTVPGLPLVRLSIMVEEDAWLAADSFVGPGVTIGKGAVLGARGCAFKDLEPWTIYGGNPAKPIKAREPF